MRHLISLTAFLFALSASVAPAAAQGRGNSGGKSQGQGPKTTTTTTTTTRGGGKPADVPKTTSASPQSQGRGNTQAAAAKADRKGGPTTTATTTTVTTTTPTTTSIKNPKLEARLLKMLPATYTSVADAAEGFPNWGLFVAAVHVSNNLTIPFNDLKLAMTGVLPDGTVSPTAKPVSLGQAIQQLKTGTTTTIAQTEAQQAQTAAAADLSANP
jgi:hypothetical protein